MKLASDAQQVASRSRMEFQALCKRQLETDAKVAELRQLVAASRIRQWDLSMCLADLTSNLHYGTLSRALSESIYRERAAQRKFVDHVQCCAKTFGDNERIIEALNQYVARSLLLAARFSASAAYFRAELASTCRTLSVQSLQLQNLETELRFRAVSRRFDEPDVCVLSRHAGHLVRIVSRMTFSYESTGEVMRSRLGQALLLAAEVGSLAAGERLQRSEVLTRAAELVRCCHALESEVAVWQSKTRCPEHEDLPSNLLSSNFLGLIGSVDVPPTNDDALTPLANLQFQLVSSLESEVHSWRRRYWDVVSCHADNTDDRAPASAVLGPWNDLRRAELRLCPVPLQVAETDSGDQLSNLHASLEGSKGTAAYLVNDLRFALGHLDSVSRRLHTVRKSNSQGIGNLGRAIKAIVHLLGRSAEWESTWGAFLAQLGVRLATLEGSIKQLHVHLYGLTNSHSRMSVRLHRATNEVVFLRARLSALSDKHDQDARQASSQYEEELAGVHDKYHNQVQETEEALRQLSHLKSRCEKLRHENGSLRLERQALLCDNHDITESLETAKARILELDSTIAAYTLKETTDMQENLHVIQALKYEKRQVQTSLELCREEVEEKRAESSALLQTIQALQVECTRHRAQVQLNEQAPRAEKLLSMASGLKHVLNLCKELREQIAEIRDETNSLANMRCQEFKRVEREIALRIDTYRSQAEIKLDSKDDELATERRRFNALLAMRRFSTGTQK